MSSVRKWDLIAFGLTYWMIGFEVEGHGLGKCSATEAITWSAILGVLGVGMLSVKPCFGRLFRLIDGGFSAFLVSGLIVWLCSPPVEIAFGVLLTAIAGIMVGYAVEEEVRFFRPIFFSEKAS